ncbi:male-specific lethal 1-like 1 [Chanos chanos]|uniref:Male-specific lethal 1-like 1 n=1 Tax=Chanos chanos TaxID=29144 RepID=A0A6J2WZF7_CHACN|nr:male-specific lethal 1 homolog [Chanos chanos]
MTMRSTVFSSGAYKLDTGIADLGKAQVGAPDSFAGLKKESCEYGISSIPSLLGSIKKTGGGGHQHFKGKTKTSASHQSLARKSGQPSELGVGQEQNLGSLGTSAPPLGKQMGGDSTPVKSKSLFGQANNSMGKMDPLVSNGNKQPREAGAAGVAVTGVSSPEHSPDGKRRNVRKGPGHAATQTNCIRQILLLQLELIEQQQQQLHNKSKEIEALKAEKEMLMARIERMERRLQMVKKDGRDPRPTHQTPKKEQEAEQKCTEGESVPDGRSHTPRPAHIGRGGKGPKRRFLFQDSRMARSRRGPQKPLPQRESAPLKEETQETVGSGSRSPGSPVVQSEELPYMATTEMYLCCWHQPPTSPWRDCSPVHEDTVDVPSWRENCLEPLKEAEASDIPESLEDGVFLKRHSKLEQDEKRRKRWDIQRIREQRMFQRLQQRMNKRKVVQESEPELLSFYPEAEDVESIMITPFLPVVAFGRPLPNLTQQSFDLPWLDERSRCRPEASKKKTPHRTCRK